MTRDTIKIKGMSCQHCVMAVKNALGKMQGVGGAEVNIGTATVSYDESKVKKSDIEGAIVGAGFEIAR